MHWGVRKTHDDSPNAKYTDRHRTEDRRVYGRGGVKRINRRMNAGSTRFKAQQSEAWRGAAKATILAGAYVTTRILAQHGDEIVGSIAQRAQTQRGRSAAANAMGLPRKATNGPTYTKQKRGAYNITTL